MFHTNLYIKFFFTLLSLNTSWHHRGWDSFLVYLYVFRFDGCHVSINKLMRFFMNNCASRVMLLAMNVQKSKMYEDKKRKKETLKSCSILSYTLVFFSFYFVAVVVIIMRAFNWESFFPFFWEKNIYRPFYIRYNLFMYTIYKRNILWYLNLSCLFYFFEMRWDPLWCFIKRCQNADYWVLYFFADFWIEFAFKKFLTKDHEFKSQ